MTSHQPIKLGGNFRYIRGKIYEAFRNEMLFIFILGVKYMEQEKVTADIMIQRLEEACIKHGLPKPIGTEKEGNFITILPNKKYNLYK